MGQHSGEDDQIRLRAREADELRAVETRLMRVFGATLGADDVRRCIDSAYAHYERVRVRTFVVLLTERRAARELRAIEQVSDRSA